MPYITKATIPKSKYGVKFNDPEYFKTKNKLYYKEIKENPIKAKATLINYYKKKYGEALVLNLIECLGLEPALNQLRVYKNELKKSNPLLAIAVPSLECY
jgi:hypothetical protein